MIKLIHEARLGSELASISESELELKSEVQILTKQWVEQHWQEWLDKPLPALQGKSPRKAATTTNGREQLEALLISFVEIKKANPLFLPPLEKLRKDLGLIEHTIVN